MNDKNDDMPDKLKMIINANWETAKEMDLSEMAIVVMEGIHNLLGAIGSEVDIRMAKIPPDELAEIVNTKNGRAIVTSLSDFASAMATVMVSIEQIQSLFPKEYNSFIDEFKKSVDEKIGKQEEAIVEEFIRSIPDAPPLEEE
jgi:hypothetical protein